MKLPAGKILIPGVITHCSNIVEHPELVAERICRYAKLVGRENVIGGSDCGFSSQATFTPEIHPTVVWAKFKAMAEGARIATKQHGSGRAWMPRNQGNIRSPLNVKPCWRLPFNPQLAQHLPLEIKIKNLRR